MSINSAMLAGVSGLVANSSALAAISDNIANVNTTGYKRNAINFGNVVTSQAAAGRYSAGGVQGALHSYTGQQGLLQTTGSSTDVAISGDGFFVVSEKAQPGAADSRLFTRSGSFSIDSSGYLMNSSGYYLQGWPVVDDVVDSNPSDLSLLSSINIKNIAAAVRPSTEIAMKGNLNASQTASAAATPYAVAMPPPPATPTAGFPALSMTQDAIDGTGTAPDFTMQTSIVDSLGRSHNVTIAFLKANASNTWHAEMYLDPDSAGNDKLDGSGVEGVPGLLSVGEVVFKPDGELDLAATTLDLAPAIGASDAASGLKWRTDLGIEEQTVTFDLGGGVENAAGSLTQLAGASVLKGVNNNGAAMGEVAGVSIDDKGFISAVFSNGEVRKIAQVAIATFANSDGLNQVSGNAYTTSIASGAFTLQKSGEGGAGDLVASSLEASTVDLSAEFTGLITTQRAYSASSKIILTADQMMEELINIKR